jgi:translation initiation factor IF-1
MKLNFTINKTEMTKKKILIIEDDNIIIKIMDYVLKRGTKRSYQRW